MAALSHRKTLYADGSLTPAAAFATTRYLAENGFTPEEIGPHGRSGREVALGDAIACIGVRALSDVVVDIGHGRPLLALVRDAGENGDPTEVGLIASLEDLRFSRRPIEASPVTISDEGGLLVVSLGNGARCTTELRFLSNEGVAKYRELIARCAVGDVDDLTILAESPYSDIPRVAEVLKGYLSPRELSIMAAVSAARAPANREKSQEREPLNHAHLLSRRGARHVR